MAGRWVVVVVGVLALFVGPATGGAPARAQTALWTSQFGTTAGDGAQAVTRDPAGNLLVVGRAGGALAGQTAAGLSDVLIRKYSSAGAVLWTRLLGSAALDLGMAVATDSSANVYVAGFTFGALPGQTALGSSDAFLAKYDASGNLLWLRQFGTSATDEALGVVVDTANHVYVVGSAQGALPGQSALGLRDAFIRKYDATGAELWTRQFGTTQSDRALAVTLEPTGNVLMGGSTSGSLETSFGGQDAFLRRYDPSGTVLLTLQFGSAGADTVYGVTVDGAGNLIAVGDTAGALPGHTNLGDFDAFVVKLTPGGGLSWIRQFGAPFGDRAFAVAADATGAVYVCGSVGSAFPGQTAAGGPDSFIRKYSSLGFELWTRQFGDVGDDLATGVVTGTAGEVYLVGGVEGALPGQTGTGGDDAFIMRLTAGATGTGFLRVTTTPAVPALITVDGLARDYWGLSWLEVPEGQHTVSFGPVAGFTTPPDQTVTVTLGQTTTVTGAYSERGSLRVLTNPAAPGQVSIDSVPRNNWGAWPDIAPGAHVVCFGPVAGFSAPNCQVGNVSAGQLTTVTGNYVSNPGGQGCPTCGLLRVTTTPAVPALISVNAQERDYWGLTWLELPLGPYTVSFRAVAGFATPADQTVTVAQGQTTTVNGAYLQLGYLRVSTARVNPNGPAANAVIYIDGVARNNYGAWPDVPPGMHQVCFGDLPGYETPPCQSVEVRAGQTTATTGVYLVLGPPPPGGRPLTTTPVADEAADAVASPALAPAGAPAADAPVSEPEI